MKKFIGCVIATCAILGLVACGSSGYAEAGQESMFEIVEDGLNYKVMYNKDTKVMYAVSDSSYNRGNFTLLVNPDGTPMLWEE